jgi:C4-dicarboxylate-specific signal transduction histidine kinase
MKTMLERVAWQTDSYCHNLFKCLDLLSHSPYVQLVIPKGPQTTDFKGIVEELQVFRINTDNFNYVALYDNNSNMIAESPVGAHAKRARLFAPIRLKEFLKHDYHNLVSKNHKQSQVVLFRKVYELKDSSREVGSVVAAVPLKKFTRFLKNLDLGSSVEKSIFDQNSIKVFQETKRGGDGEPSQEVKEYDATLPLLNWRMVVRIPESVIFRDVNRLAWITFAFCLFVALLTFFASLFFSKRITRPVAKVIKGVQKLAAGDFDHRIDLSKGPEMRSLAREFNCMAASLQKRQSELIEAAKLASLGLLSTGFAHELKAPLSGIRKTASELMEKSKDSPQTPLARDIIWKVDCLDRIMGELLEYAVPRPSKAEPCNLKEIVERSLSLVGGRMNEKGVNCQWNIYDLMVVVDKEQMIQVLVNLLIIALSEVPDAKGEIKLVSWLNSSDEVVLLISDNGCGMDQKKIDRIFDPLFALYSQGKDPGFSMIYSLLKQNQVRVQVNTKNNKGTTFRLVFTSAISKAFNQVF